VPENENFHPTTRLVDPKGEPADIDVELAPLVQLLWRLGIETITCCQDVGESIAPLARDLPHVASEAKRLRGSAQVDFPIDAGLRFLTAVARAGGLEPPHIREQADGESKFQDDVVVTRGDDLHEVGSSPGRHKAPPSLVVGATGDAVVINECPASAGEPFAVGRLA